MLCTNSNELLYSVNGRTTLNFKPPKKQLNYSPTAKNIVVAWDILMQDFRAISVDDCEVLREYPANDGFWEVFNEKFYPMSPEQKLLYMNA